MEFLGLDIGATKIRYLMLDKQRNNFFLDKELKYSGHRQQDFFRVLKTISADKELKKFKFKKIGAGIAGIIQDGRLVYSPNFPELLGLNLNKIIKEIFQKPAIVENDANCFAYAEALIGAAKNFRYVVGLTLGSGLGGGIVLDKKIYRGRGAAGEVGHTIIKLTTDNLKLKTLEVEDLCSEKFFRKLSISNPLVLEIKARKGNIRAKRIYERFGNNLGLAIANIVNVLDPEVIVLGGGLANAYVLFIVPARQTAEKFIVSPVSKKIPILKSRFGKSAGALGAALMATKYEKIRN